MAVTTDKALRNQVLYSVFVRNYSERGDFEGVRQDLKRIRDLYTQGTVLCAVYTGDGSGRDAPVVHQFSGR